MTIYELRQHLTVKNIFIAIVALNVLSVLPASRMGGTFQNTSEKVVQTPTKVANVPAADPGLIAHMMPGEESLAHAGKPEKSPHAVSKPASRTSTASQRKSDGPPNVGWIMLLSVGAMALYARYLAARMAQNAVEHAVSSVKHIFGALKGVSPDRRPQANAEKAARTPSAQAPKVKAAQPRNSTVVRPSRWPFAA